MNELAPGQSPTLARPDTPLTACAQRRPTNENRLPWQRPLSDRKTNFRLVIDSRSSTKSENLAKVGSVDF